MLSQPKVGTAAERKFTVEAAHSISFGPNGPPPVLSTPWLVWFLEHAALDAALPFLESGEITVGTHVEVDHLAPTPVGAQVTCTARIVHSDGPVISFQLEAGDGHETTARGFHKRRVVKVDRFAARVKQKENKSQNPNA
ncbi:MAG: thioesterase family protein [Deltaproteobacteria bacterium]